MMSNDFPHALLAPEQMGACDRLTIERGTAGTVLMEQAGEAVAVCAQEMVGPGSHILIACGPGNNGGDGYVAARLLAGKGYHVQALALDPPDKLSGDARWAYGRWNGATDHFDGQDPFQNQTIDLIIDALFGAGLRRGLDGRAAELVRWINRSHAPVLSVDLPSGVDGRTGHASKAVVCADRSVTFHRLKPGHALYPGRDLCGPITVADIGLASDAVRTVGFTAQTTSQTLMGFSTAHKTTQHKFNRGHALIVCGPPHKAGAAFLAANAALRCGAGLVSLAATHAVLHGSIGHAPALMRQACNSVADLAAVLAGSRWSSCAIGPGLPPDENTRQMVEVALQSGCPVVLDAGALSAFSGQSERLFGSIRFAQSPVILTPHHGEFARLFDKPEASQSKIETAQEAAKRSGAVVVYKGADTVIAHPNGSALCTYVNGNAPPWLATAGSGDVLTGVIAGRLAGMDANEDALLLTRLVAQSVWLHGEAGRVAGPALTAHDLEPALRVVLERYGDGIFNALPEAGVTGAAAQTGQSQPEGQNG